MAYRIVPDRAPDTHVTSVPSAEVLGSWRVCGHRVVGAFLEW